MSPPRPTTSTLPRKTPIYQKQPKKNQKDSDPSHHRRTEGSSATSCPALGPPLPGPFQQPPPPREPGLPCPARPPRVPSVPPRPPASPRLLPGPSLLPEPLRAAPSPWPRRSGSGPTAPRSRPAPGEAAAGGHRGGSRRDPGGSRRGSDPSPRSPPCLRAPLRPPLPAGRCRPCFFPRLLPQPFAVTASPWYSGGSWSLPGCFPEPGGAAGIRAGAGGRLLGTRGAGVSAGCSLQIAALRPLGLLNIQKAGIFSRMFCFSAANGFKWGVYVLQAPKFGVLALKLFCKGRL